MKNYYSFLIPSSIKELEFISIAKLLPLNRLCYLGRIFKSVFSETKNPQRVCTYHVISNGFSDLWCWRNWVNIQKSPKNCNAFINPNIILSSKDKINNEYGSSITNGGNKAWPTSVPLMD